MSYGKPQKSKADQLWEKDPGLARAAFTVDVASWLGNKSLVGIKKVPEIPTELKGQVTDYILEIACKQGRVFQLEEIKLILQWHGVGRSGITDNKEDERRWKDQFALLKFYLEVAKESAYRGMKEKLEEVQTLLKQAKVTK